MKEILYKYRNSPIDSYIEEEVPLNSNKREISETFYYKLTYFDTKVGFFWFLAHLSRRLK